MSKFEDARQNLTDHRQELEAKRRDALLVREAARQSERLLSEFARSDTPDQGQERERLETALKEAQTRAQRVQREFVGLRDRGASLLGAFESFTDPREQLSEWPALIPILLFPLRLETRFKTGDAKQAQLWVRVYPDTCLIDSFEASLSEAEVANARVFWAAIWRAGGDEALERAAWRELVASHGSGRAGWIVRQYMPLNPNDKPPRDSSTDVLLIITASEPLPAEAATYWRAVWKAQDPGSQQNAFDDLKRAVGEQKAREIADQYRPFNFSDSPAAPHTRADVQVKVAVLLLTPLEDLQTRRTSWSSAPHAKLLPERFVLVAYPRTGAPLTAMGNLIRTPLIAGPDPNAPPEQQLKQVDDTLEIPEDMAWMFDFEKALEVGMAFRIDLTADQAREGFERVVVVGLRFADSPRTGAQSLETLLEHHLHSRAGLEIVPQGTPTNNTEKGGSGYSFRDDSETTFNLFFKAKPEYTLEGNPQLRRDGEWLADLLGLSNDFTQRIPNAGGADQSEARAMQIALWPGTLGYMMKTLLAPVFSDQEIAATRNFFTRYVSGRGPLPAIRVGAQPYSILPVTAFDRIDWFGTEGDEQVLYLGRLYGILKRIDADWKPLVDQVSFIGKQGGDPHQILLDVLGLHPSSVEYYPLQADSVEHKFYELAFLDFAIALIFLDLFPAIIPLTLLRSFGYAGTEVPDLLNKVYKARQTPLDGPLIDDRPLSESEPIRKYAGNQNYIEWLVAAARTGISAIQQERGFDNDKKPTALLYLLLRHALQLSIHETGVKLEVAAGAAKDVTTMLREPAFVHVSEQVTQSESRYDVLFRPQARVTGSADLLLGDHIARNLTTVDPDLSEQIAALERLSRLPTARLERIFAEHIDSCSYRLDAWKMGLLGWQLDWLRRVKQQVAPGLFLGAYGWLEPLRPKNRILTNVELPADLAEPINRRDKSALMRDSTNAGLIHGPSINHATTAAVLRNGYIANDGRLAINLTSRRVRLALGILEGMRNGQSIGALLGYQLERHIHDNGPLQVRAAVYDLRRAFPLVADQITKTKTEGGEARETIAAMNVVDGRKLIEHVERQANFIYPFGLATLPRRAANQEAAITDAVAHIRDINDAVADLVLAEGVHQAVIGNYERSAGTLDAFAKGNYPPEPEVIRTPRSGIALTLRTAIHFSPVPPANPQPLIALTPLANAEPAVNAWLTGRLPEPSNVGCHVSFTKRTDGSEHTEFVDQVQLGLHAIDLVYRADANHNQALSDLEDQILLYIETKHAPRHDREIRIQHTERVAGRTTWFELNALLLSLRSLVVGSRPLQPADLTRANDAARDDQAAVSLDPSLVHSTRDDLANVLLPALDGVATTVANAAGPIDEALRQFATTVSGFSAYRLPQTGTGFVFEWRSGFYSQLTKKIDERIKTWNERLARYEKTIQAYDDSLSSIPFDERIPKLQAAELIISTKLTTPPPVDAAAYRLALNGRHQDFVDKRDALQQSVTVARATATELLNDAKAQLPLTDFDPDALSFTEDDQEIARFRAELIGAIARLKDDVSKRIARIDALLIQHDASGPADKVAILQQAAKVLFGDDFQMVPQITLSGPVSDELANAWQHSTSGGLTHFLTDPSGGGRDFPVDDWLHGIARVREKMRHWENAVLLGDAFTVAQSSELTPLQLPYKPGEPWLALEMPDNHQIDSDRLLYTAHFAEAFDKSRPVRGLLVDEWTEVIPGTEETTGIAFHYDRPNCEPPQSWLLALPPIRDGAWAWDNLLEAINNALDSAKRRAIEPIHIDDTAYTWFLPATVSAYTFPEISISNNLLRNLDIYTRLTKE